MTITHARSIRRRSALAGAMLAAGGGLIVATAQPAAAHQVCRELGRNWGCVSTNHQTVSVHDLECNNRYVYTRYRTTEIPGAAFTLTDLNGCRSGGNYVSVSPYRVTAITICEGSIDNCLPWRTA